MTAAVTQNIQKSAFLREQRNFPKENIQALTVEIDRAYVDTAQKVNNRIIGRYGVNFPSTTGESWFLTGQPNKQQTLRQLYTFTTAGNIPHGINWKSVSMISPLSYGTFTDGTNWYGCLYASSVAIAGQLSFYVTPVNIVVLSGAGAPSLTSGTINLEWLSTF